MELSGVAHWCGASRRGAALLERALATPHPLYDLTGLRGRWATLADARGQFEETVRLNNLLFQSHPDDTISLYGNVLDLATLKRFQEAESYVTGLEKSDQYWGFGARLLLLTLRGDLAARSESLRLAFSNPLATNSIRGIVCFMLGDVETAVSGIGVG